jgi:hypothetical protein
MLRALTRVPMSLLSTCSKTFRLDRPVADVRWTSVDRALGRRRSPNEPRTFPMRRRCSAATGRRGVGKTNLDRHLLLSERTHEGLGLKALNAPHPR